MKKKEELLLLFDKKVFFRKLIPSKNPWLIKTVFNYGFTFLFLLLSLLVISFLFNSIFIPPYYKKINNYLNLFIVAFSLITFLYLFFDEYLTFKLLKTNYKEYLSDKNYRKEKHLIFREIQSDYLLFDFFKNTDKQKVKKIRKELKKDLKTFSNVFNISDSTYAILIVPAGLALLQWYMEKIKTEDGFRQVYVYVIIYLLLSFTLFYTIKNIKNTLYIAKKEKYRRLINILRLVEKKLEKK